MPNRFGLGATRRVLGGLALASALGGAGCFQGDLGEQGRLLGRHGYTPKPRVTFQRWRAQVNTTNENWDYKPIEHATAALDDEGQRVYIGSRGAELHAYELRSGKLVWSLKLPREIRSEPVYKDGVLYLGTADGYFYAIDAETHEIKWKYFAKSEVTARAVVTEDRVYFTSAEHTVYAVDRDSGEWKWSYSRSVPEGFTIQGIGGPLLHKRSVFVGFADGFLVSLKAEDGALQWEKKLSNAPRFADVDSTPVAAGGAILVSCFPEGLFALDPDDGLIRWKIPARGAGTPAVKGDEGFFTTPSGEVVSFSVGNGAVRWRSRISEVEGHLSDPSIRGSYVLVSMSHVTPVGTEGGVWLVDRRTGRVAHVVEVGSGVHPRPVAEHGHLLFLANSGWFYAYRFAFTP